MNFFNCHRLACGKFSTKKSNNHVYDLITIGPYANRIAKQVTSLIPHPISILTIQQQNFTYQPTLIPYSSPIIKLNQQNHKFSDIQQGVGIAYIDTHKDLIILKNGNEYTYRQLIYSGDIQDWKQNNTIGTNPNKNQSYKNDIQYIYNDKNIQKITQLFTKKQSNKIVFIIPKDIHLGYNNYFMMLLKDKIQSKQFNRFGFFNKDSNVKDCEVAVICQGDSLCPQNKQYGQIVYKYFENNNIKTIKNVSNYTINHKSKTLSLPNQTSIPFTSIFQYTPMATPTILKKSSIDPFLTNPYTFMHPYQDNLHIVLPASSKHIYSLSTISHISTVIAYNVMFNIIGVNKKAIYEGQGSIGLWTGEHDYLEIQLQKQKVKKLKGDNKLLRKGLGLFKGQFLKNQVQKFINHGNFSLVTQKPKFVNATSHNIDQVLKKQLK